MIAASLLVVAVTATYASLAMLSLSVSAPSVIVNAAGKVGSFVGRVGWQKPSVGGLINVQPPSESSFGLADVSLNSIPFGSTHGTGTSTVAIGNSTTKPLLLHVAVVGDHTLGLTANFATAAGGSTMLVPPKHSELVSVVSNPLRAGPFSASLQISVPHSHITPKLVPIYGAQAPEAPGPVTATPAVGGAVDLSWTPSPSTGVAGYIVESSTAGSPFTPVGALTTGTTAVEQTGTNGTTFSYQVVAVAQGVTPQLPSTPGGVGSAQTDSQAPIAPLSVAINPPSNSNYINSNNCLSIPVSVALAGSSSPNDTITLTVTSSGGGQPFTQTYAGGSSLNVSPNLCSLADGNVTASATAADSLGNTSGATQSDQATTKDTVPPHAPGSVLPSFPTITSGNMNEFTVAVQTDAFDSTDILVVSVGSGSSEPVTLTGAGTTTIPVPLTGVPDGAYNITGTITDAAGNTTSFTGPQVTINTVGPVKPTSFGVDAGPSNPADVINASSQTAVMIDAQFAQATDPNATYTLTVAHGAQYLPTSGVGSTDISFGPLDLSSLPDGHVSLELTMTDSNGNFTNAWHGATKNTSGPTAPTSVGVPAGPSNPAGYVNSATQSAATIVAQFDAPTDPADQINLSVDGDQLATQSGGSDQASWTADLSNLPDGTLPITGTITDAYGNVTDFSGSLIKDTQAPPAPVAASVVGPPLNTITPQDASCVNVAVAFNVAVDPADTVTVTLSDGETSVQGSAQAGNGLVTVGCIDASSLAAGPISVSVTVTDVAGNSTTSAGTTATKLPPCDHQGGGGGSGGEGGGGGGSDG